MTATLLDGRALAKAMREELVQEIAAFTASRGSAPTLTVVRVLGDPAAERYVRSIEKACGTVGITFTERLLHSDTTQATLEAAVREVSAASAVDAVLLNLPLPRGFDTPSVIWQLDPAKDIDGIHPVNAGLLVQERPRFIPNTPAGGMELLKAYGIEIFGRRVVVIGRSGVVGKPMALMLMQENATVTICHRYTVDLAAAVRQAEIVVSAAGVPGLVTGDMLLPGAVIIDFGMNVLADGKVVGDVDFASAVEVVSAITPVPGGTGPVTNVMLLRNVLRAAAQRDSG